ncbi:MAG: Gfo/Idh/MocA family oxidoreductase [Candidatus Bathyarchaeia archaeon]
MAVVGTGSWGQNHVRVYNELPETKLVGVCDVNPEKVQAVAEKFDVKGYTDSGKLLKREDVEAVSICVWSTKLAEEAVKALEAGKHVLVEKPMASSVQQAEKIVELARRNDLRLMVGFIERFNGVQGFKEAIDRGKIGILVSATARRLSKWPERIGDVGVVKDMAIHDIDVMRHIFTEDPIAVYANAGNLNHRKFEDYAQITLTFEDEKTAFIEANWLTPHKIRRLIATGSEAIVSLNYLTHEISFETEEETQTRNHSEEPLKLELRHFASCVSDDKEPLVTGVDGLKALLIAETALKSASKHRTIELRRDD